MRGRRVAGVPPRTRSTACRWAARAPSTSPSGSSPTCRMRCGRAPSSSPARSKMAGSGFDEPASADVTTASTSGARPIRVERVVQRHVPVRHDADREARRAQALHHVGRVGERQVGDGVGEARQDGAGVEVGVERVGEHAGALEAHGRERRAAVGAVADRAVVPHLGPHRHVAAVEREVESEVLGEGAAQARDGIGEGQDRAHRVERDRVEVFAARRHEPGCSTVTRAASRAGRSGDGVKAAGSTIAKRLSRTASTRFSSSTLRSDASVRGVPGVTSQTAGLSRAALAMPVKPFGTALSRWTRPGERWRRRPLDEHVDRRLALGAAERVADALVDRPGQLDALRALARREPEPRELLAGDRRVGQRPAQHRHARRRLHAGREDRQPRQRLGREAGVRRRRP